MRFTIVLFSLLSLFKVAFPAEAHRNGIDGGPVLFVGSAQFDGYDEYIFSGEPTLYCTLHTVSSFYYTCNMYG